MAHHPPTIPSRHSVAAPAQEPCPGCGACQCEDGGAGPGPAALPTGLRGWRLVVTAGGLFLVPLIMAAVAATVFRSSATVQLAAACGALAVGMVGSLTAARWLHGAGAGREQP